MVLDPIPQSLPVRFFGSRPQPPTSHPEARFNNSSAFNYFFRELLKRAYEIANFVGSFQCQWSLFNIRRFFSISVGSFQYPEVLFNISRLFSISGGSFQYQWSLFNIRRFFSISVGSFQFPEALFNINGLFSISVGFFQYP